ncbi:MAG: ABC transporter permease subunit [Chloroflexi bacterium]|nr:ABC transporter permease subunit [Chloroflexota bacterium]
MKNVRSPLASIALNLLGWPLGIWLGFQAGKFLLGVSDSFAENIWMNAASVGVSLLLIVFGARWSLSRGETDSSTASRILAQAISIVTAALAIYAVLELGSLGMNLGLSMIESLGLFGFLGNFLFQSGDILRTITPALSALIAGGIVSSGLGRWGQSLSERLPVQAARLVNATLAAVTGALLFIGIAQTLNWFYEIGNPLYAWTLPAILGALGGLTLAFLNQPKASLPIGLAVYTVTRTIVNAVRSVEAVIMAIVFVIFVGIGPFAGVMALGLHTIASLVKLYSEQVESISAGPLEAVEATGANRLQTIIYAVIPQIIPPYISYTMYRWDINVRMSTIIGITGGGGIGFLLVQNINLLDYNAASTQMLAIAIVVSLMDYVSSALREKAV